MDYKDSLTNAKNLIDQIEQGRSDDDLPAPTNSHEVLEDYFETSSQWWAEIPTDSVEKLHEARKRVEETKTISPQISTSSSKPGGSFVHKLAGKLVGRQIASVTEQVNTHNQNVADLAEAVDDVLDDLARGITQDPNLKGTLLARIEEMDLRIQSLQRKVEELESE